MCNHTWCAFYSCLFEALGGAYIRHGFKARRVSFLRRAGCCKGKGAETKKDVRFAGRSPVTVEGEKNEKTRVTKANAMRF